MTELLQAIGVALLAVGCVFLGRVFSRSRGRAWVLGYLLPLCAILMIVAARRLPWLALRWPFSWLMAGRAEFALFGPLCALVLTTPLPRLRNGRLKPLITLFILFVVAAYSVLPFLQPLLIREKLVQVETELTDGVCVQSLSYTCGPAAAVTALAQLGLRADEGELAIRSHTSPIAGTSADLLMATLRERYGPHGLRCIYRAFESVGELRDAGLVLAEINLSLTVDHWVVVFAVTDNCVVLGDPACGRRTVTRDQFRRTWRFIGIVVDRNGKGREAARRAAGVPAGPSRSGAGSARAVSGPGGGATRGTGGIRRRGA